jgi:secreted Zn-dependent insulinase-like peptidase
MKIIFVFLNDLDSSIYPKSDVDLAISSRSDLDFLSFVKIKDAFNTKLYSGQFADLLNLDSSTGTLASVSVSSNTYDIRINGTFLHVPAVIQNLLSQYHLA